MANKDLRAEVRYYSKTYGEILVGIHNDLIDYKNKVNSHSKESVATLRKCKKILNHSEYLKDSTLETYKKIEKSESKINSQLKEIKNKINEYQGYLKNYEVELEQKIVSLNKSNDDFKKGIIFNEKLSLENFNIKESIESLHNRLSDTESSLNQAEKKISKLASYHVVFIFVFSLLFILIIINIFR